MSTRQNKIVMMILAVAVLGLGTAMAKEKGKDKENRREKNVEKRQGNQEKRIEQGIKKGYLTSEETKALEDQQKKIGDMESSIKSDGKISADEAKQLKDTLDVASANIWADKHNADGNQMPVYRLGKDVYAKDSFTSQFSNPNLTGAQARVLTGDFKKMLDLKRSLSNDDLTDDARAKKQTEYNTLLNNYFEVR